MAYKELADLTARLYRTSLEGQVNWEETVLKDVYQASLANYSVRISLEESQSSMQSDVRISIVNSEGTIVESFSDVDLDPEWLNEFQIEESPYRIMLNTYEVARRTALGAEKAIKDIVRELRDKEIPF